MSEVQQVIKWEDPPPRRRAAGRRDWTAVREALMSRPGAWAVVFLDDGTDAAVNTSKGIVSGIRSGQITAFLPRGAFEAAYRRMDDNTSAVYARFLGEEPGA